MRGRPCAGTVRGLAPCLVYRRVQLKHRPVDTAGVSVYKSNLPLEVSQGGLQDRDFYGRHATVKSVGLRVRPIQQRTGSKH